MMVDMELQQTKVQLQGIVTKYGEGLRDAVVEIRPTLKVGGITGYRYDGYSNSDTNFIYQSIFSLSEMVNDDEGPFHFQIKDNYVLEAEALKDLRRCWDAISGNLKKLHELDTKYKDKETTEYPLSLCLQYYNPICNLLEQILESEEVIEFEKPGTIKKLAKENLGFYSRDDWSEYKWKCILHLASFFVYIGITLWFVYDKEEKLFKNSYFKWGAIFFLSILTIIFNIGFNNYQTFRDSWKIFNRKAWKKLKEKRLEQFKPQKK